MAEQGAGPGLRGARCVPWALGELAEALGAGYDGPPETVIDRAAALDEAAAGALAYLSDRRLKDRLQGCRAAAVVLRPADRGYWAGPALLSDNPELTFARAAARLHPAPEAPPGVHEAAVVAPDARLGEGVHIAAQAVVEAGAALGDGAFIGPGAVIGAGAEIGPGTRVEARAVVAGGCRVGARCRLEPGVVVGSEGFGFARDGARWERIPQLAGVRLGDEVEIGANSAVDRGTFHDTVIEDGAKIDNMVQIGHNCRIGAHTAIAGQVGIAGSTAIGPGCTLGGQAGFADHLQIAGGCHFTGQAMVTRSIDAPGVYSSGMPVQPGRRWRRSVARIEQLEALYQRVQALERAVAGGLGRGGEDEDSATEDGE